MLLPLWLNLQAATPPPTTSGDQPTGGWAAYNHYDLALQARERRRRAARLEEEAEEIQDSLDRQIAVILHQQEELDASREERQRLRELAALHGELEAISRRVAEAAARVEQKATESALEALGRELERAREEEDVAALLVLLNQ